MNRRIAIYQWAQLLVLSLVHFTVDMFGNTLPSILPAIREEFAMSLSMGTIVVVALTIAANGVQMFTGSLRAKKTKPFFLHLGMVLAISICLLASLPRLPFGVGIMVLLAVIAGFGIGSAHPEGLRAVHALSRIPAAISTAVFMTGGFLGFACGGIISAALVSRWGLPGLYRLMLAPILGILLVILLRIRLAVELSPGEIAEPMPMNKSLPFRFVMIMAMPGALSTTILALLLPSRLNEIGFELTFGGYSATMFGLGGALGSFLWAWLAHKKGELLCSAVAFLLAAPLTLAYLLFMNDRRAVWLIFAAGFFAFAAYILLITLARYAAGYSLGARMGWVVGGTWLFSNIIFLPLVLIGERLGTHLIMHYAPVGYLLSGFIGIYLMLKTRTESAPNRS